MDQTDTSPVPPEPAHLRRLRRLVTTLTLTLIVGMAVITGLLVYRLGPGMRNAPIPPEAIPLPAGEDLTGLSITSDWTILITRDAEGAQRVHIVPRGGRRITASIVLSEE